MNFIISSMIACVYLFIGTLVSAVCTDDSKPLNLAIVAFWPFTVVSIIFIAICASFYALGKRIKKLWSNDE